MLRSVEYLNTTHMKKIILASTNPVKVAVAKAAFAVVFPDTPFEVIPVATLSGVPPQPFDDEALEGAMNRLRRIRTSHPKADYWVSQEGGLVRDGESFYNRAWILFSDKKGHIGKSSTPSFEIPKGVAELVRTGLELADASDVYFGMKGPKHTVGGVSLVTDGLIDRKRYYLQAAIIALAQVKNHKLYE